MQADPEPTEMPLDEPQHSALGVILQACADECIRGLLGNLAEMHLKVVAADALLRAGYSILEPANAKGQGRAEAEQSVRAVRELLGELYR